MAVTTDILAAYRRPRAAVARQFANTPREDRALLYLILACGLIFVGQWPRLAREAHLMPDVPLDARLGGALLAWGFIAPLVFYGIAAVLRLLAMPFRGRGSWYRSRLALFWGLLCAAPLWMLHGLAAGFLGAGPGLSLLGLPVFAVTLWIVGQSLREAEWPRAGIAESGKVA